MAEINVINDFYLPLRKDEEMYSSKEYKLLRENNVDTAKLVGYEQDKDAGVIELGKEDELSKTELANEVLGFVGALPKDMVLSIIRGGVNGFDFIKDMAAAATYGNEQLPEDSIFKFIDEKTESLKENINTLEQDDPLVTRMIGALGQDAAYVYPIYKKFKSIGIPKQFALPTAFALGSTLAFDKSTSFMLDTETINGFKNAINIDPNTPAEEMFDKLVQFVEFSGMGFAFNKIAPMFKAMKNIDVKKAAVVSGGTAAATAGALEVEDNIQNNIISETTEKE